MHDELVLVDGLAQLFGRDARVRLQVLGQQGLDVFEHGRLLQRAEHVQSQGLAELSRAGQHALVHAAGQQDSGGHVLARQVAQRLDAIHAGHLQVEQDQRRLSMRQLFAKAGGGVGGDDGAAHAPADLFDQFQEVRFIVHCQ